MTMIMMIGTFGLDLTLGARYFQKYHAKEEKGKISGQISVKNSIQNQSLSCPKIKPQEQAAINDPKSNTHNRQREDKRNKPRTQC